MKHKVPFTKTGVKFFLDSTLSKIFSDLENDKCPDKLIISIGNKYLEIDILADTWNELEAFIETALKIEKGEY